MRKTPVKSFAHLRITPQKLDKPFCSQNPAMNSNTRLLLEHPVARNHAFFRLARVATVPILGAYEIKNRVTRLLQNSITVPNGSWNAYGVPPDSRPLIPTTPQVLMEYSIPVLSVI